MPEITKISHGLTIGNLKYGNVKPGVVEATLKPGETMEDALDELDNRLNAWHRKKYPHLYQEEQYPQPFPNNPDPRFHHMTSGQISTEITYGPLPIISKEEEPGPLATMMGIENAKSLEELKSFKLLINNDKQLYDAYCQKLKELTK